MSVLGVCGGEEDPRENTHGLEDAARSSMGGGGGGTSDGLGDFRTIIDGFMNGTTSKMARDVTCGQCAAEGKRFTIPGFWFSGCPHDQTDRGSNGTSANATIVSSR